MCSHDPHSRSRIHLPPRDLRNKRLLKSKTSTVSKRALHGTRLLPVNPGDVASSQQGIASVWARMKIADLYDRSAWQRADVSAQIKAVALEHNLISAFTAFVSVDSRTHTTGDHGTTVRVAVPVPEGVRYETTVQE